MAAGMFRFRKKKPSVAIATFGPGGPTVPPTWSLPEGLKLQHDTLPARWVEEALTGPPWATVGSLIPADFEAYARILHPAYRNSLEPGTLPEPVSWAAVAAANGRVIHPLVQFARIAGLGDDLNEQPSGMQRPFEGDMPHGSTAVLKRALMRHTSTPERCWFCVWHGFGGLSILEGYDERHHPTVRTPAREYLLLSGSLDALDLFEGNHYLDGPNIWWPNDRAWCVASEIDLDSTYVGGSRECVEQLLHDDALEVLPATLEDRVDGHADTINPTKQ